MLWPPSAESHFHWNFTGKERKNCWPELVSRSLHPEVRELSIFSKQPWCSPWSIKGEKWIWFISNDIQHWLSLPLKEGNQYILFKSQMQIIGFLILGFIWFEGREFSYGIDDNCCFFYSMSYEPQDFHWGGGKLPPYWTIWVWMNRVLTQIQRWTFISLNHSA